MLDDIQDPARRTEECMMQKDDARKNPHYYLSNFDLIHIYKNVKTAEFTCCGECMHRQTCKLDHEDPAWFCADGEKGETDG